MLKDRVNILLVGAEVALTDRRDGTEHTEFVVARADDMALPVEESIKAHFAQLGMTAKSRIRRRGWRQWRSRRCGIGRAANNYVEGLRRGGEAAC